MQFMARDLVPDEGRKSVLASTVLARLYPRLPSVGREAMRKLILRLEHGAVYSLTVRELYRRHHGVDVGLYSIGPCDTAPGNLGPGTKVGRYSSVYYTVRTLTAECPKDDSTPAIVRTGPKGPGKLLRGAVPVRITIGNDVWIGHNAIILPSVREIGDGAVVGAGSVVTSDIPPYAVVTGNPARVVRYRFTELRIKELLDEQWWRKDAEELCASIVQFQKPLEGFLR